MSVIFSPPSSPMNHSKTESSSSSITLQADELNKPFQEDPLKLKRLVTFLTTQPPRTSKENVVENATSQIIRSGNVKLKGYGIFNGIWKTKWLELREQSLTIHRRKGSPYQAIICSQDIVTIERTTLKPHCLFLKVKGKKYWLSIDGDEELYGWLDDIIHHCHLNHITTPENFVHHVHVHYDHIVGRFQGLPTRWENILYESDGCFEEEDEVEMTSGVALQYPRIIGPKFVLRRPPCLYPDHQD